MLNDVHVLDSLPAYALGSLEEDEAQRVADHIAGCYICRTELQTFQNVADQLLLMTPQALPSGNLKLRLMEQVRGARMERHRPFWGWSASKRMLGAGALAGLLLIVALALSNLALLQKLSNARTVTGPLGMRAIALQNTDAAPGASGFVIVSADGQNGVLVVDELRMLDPAREEYQLWLLKNGEFTSASLFSVDEEGYRGMRLEAPQSLLVYSAVSITIEPLGGSVLPTGEAVLGGSLFNP